MRGENRKPIVSCLKLPQFTIMNVIEGQAGLVIYSSLIFYCLTIDNILNIIILIILAGVSISILVSENGIIEMAKKAKENVELSQIEEQTALNELYTQMGAELGESDGISYDAIAKLAEFKKKIAEAITKNGVETNETDTVEIMAKNIDEIRKEETTPGISINNLKAGDYIKYNTGVASVGENGVITCRVLYEASSAYGLQIISDKNVANITLGGSDWATARVSYNNAIKTLNDEAVNYLNTTYATDARCVGSVPTVKNGIFIDKNSENIGPVQLQFTPTVEGANNMKDTDTNYTTDETQMAAASIWTTGEYYWLASRIMHSFSNYGNFCVFLVNSSGGLNAFTFCVVYSGNGTDGRSNMLGLRPCFSLRSDIKITGGDGKTGNTAYIIE